MPNAASSETDHLYISIIIACHSIARKHKMAIEKYVEEHGLQNLQHRMILTISRLGEEVCQKDLANALRVTPSAIAITLKKLEKMGVVEKKVSETDNRFNVIGLTKEGKKIVKESEAMFKYVDESIFQGFSEEELLQTRQLLSRIDQNLGELVK